MSSVNLLSFLPFFTPSKSPKTSIIIPTYNSSLKIRETITSIFKNSHHSIEILIVDSAKTTDPTTQVSLQSGAHRALKVSGGRGAQLNEGAKLSTAPTLLFLHDDTFLPKGFDDNIEQLLGRQNIIAGCFRLRIKGGGFGVRVVERAANFRSRWFGLPYGDQGLFMRRDVFERIGGFKNMPFLDDYEMVRRIGKRGKIGMTNSAILTSGKRWEKLGVVRTTLMNQAVLLGYHLGVPVERLRRWYRGALMRAVERDEVISNKGHL